MALWMKVGVFIIFLTAYILWVVVSIKIVNKLQADLLREKSVFSSELVLIISLLGQFTFIWLLSGFFSIELIGLFFLLGQVGYVIAALIWAILGSPHVDWGARSMWAGGEFGFNNVILMTVIQILAFIVIIGYPIVAGIIYFHNAIPSEQATILIFRITFVGLFISGIIATLPVLVGMLQSKNLDEDTRTRVFIVQGGSIASYALYISLILWSFGDISGEGYQLIIGTIPLTISPFLLIILVAFFAFVFLLPYLAGSQRAKRWKKQLLQEQQAWFDELLKTFEFSAPDHYVSKLEQLFANLENHIKQFVANDTGLSLSIDYLDQDPVDPDFYNLSLAYKKSRYLDPRFQYLNYLENLKEEIHESIIQLSSLVDNTELNERAGVYITAYRARRKNVEQAIEKTEQSKPAVWVGLAFIISPVVGQIFSEFGKWIWTVFSQSLG